LKRILKNGSFQDMRIIFLFLCLAIASRGEDWTVDGKDYHNIKVTGSDDSTVSIMYDGGIGRVNLSDLPPDLQKRFNYDPIKAKAAEKAEAEREAESDRQLDMEMQQQAKAAALERTQDQAEEEARQKALYQAEANQVAWDSIKNSIVRLYGSVLEKVDGGYLIETLETQQGFETADSYGYYATSDGSVCPANMFQYPVIKSDTKIFLASHRDLVDDDCVDFLVCPTGEGSYQTVLGANATVRKYVEMPISDPKVATQNKQNNSQPLYDPLDNGDYVGKFNGPSRF